MDKLFQTIDFETISTCNRVCPTCIRNSHPNKDSVSSFFEKNYLSKTIIKDALDQCLELNYQGSVILSHYNEPLIDERLPDLVYLAKQYPFKSVFFNTNGDFLTEELAEELESAGLDHIIVSLYMDEPKKSIRGEWIKSLFHKTFVSITSGEHIPTHFSPKFDLESLIEKYKNNPCSEPEMRVIINHRRQYLLCCDDVVGNFNLGTFPEIGIKDYWYGEQRLKIANDLKNSGGRLKYSYCSICPRS